MKHIKRAAIFLRLVDSHDGLISLTNVALIVVLTKLAIAPAVGLTEIGGLFVALLSHQGKKIINGQSQDSVDDKIGELLKPVTDAATAAQTKIEEMQSTVSSLALKVGLSVKK